MPSSDPTQAGILRDVDAYYSRKIRAHGPTPQGVDWNSQEAQEIRFRQLSGQLPARDFSLTDYGCGYGAYYDFLASRHPGLEYVGVDVSADMVDQAQRRHSGATGCRFVCADRPPAPTGFVVASGIFNVRQDVPDATWLEYIHHCLAVMDANSTHGFAFNCLTAYSDEDRKRDYLYYADPGAMFHHCMRYSRHVRLLHDYGLYEFTLLVTKVAA